jgi:hypothetical protein
MLVALPLTRQSQLLTNNFAAAENLQISEKGNPPVLENQKAGVFILNQPTHLCPVSIVFQGGDAMN